MSSEVENNKNTDALLSYTDHRKSDLPVTAEDFHYEEGQGCDTANLEPDESRRQTADDSLLKEFQQSQEKTPRKKSRTVSFSDDVSVSFTDDFYDDSRHENEKKSTSGTRGKHQLFVGEDDIDVPYDRGWAWMIDLACFVLIFVYLSHEQWHSVLFIDYLQQFNISVSTVTTMMSIGTMCYCIATQISTNLLVVRYSIRVVLTCAAILNVGATLLFSAAPTVATFFIVNFIKYTAKGVTIIAVLVLVGLYFQRRRGLATTLGLLGVSASYMCAPPLIRYLRDEYGFRACFFILAGLEMHGIVAALLLRPISNYRRKRVQQENSKITAEEVNLVTTENPDDQTRSPEHINIAEILSSLPVPSAAVTEISVAETGEIFDDQADVEMAFSSDRTNNGHTDTILKIRTEADTSSGSFVQLENSKFSDDIDRQHENKNEERPAEKESRSNIKEEENGKNLINKNNEEINKNHNEVPVNVVGISVGQKESDDTTTAVPKSAYQIIIDTNKEQVETHRAQVPPRENNLSQVSIPKVFRASSLSFVTSSTMGSTLNIPHIIEEPAIEFKEDGRKCSWVNGFIDLSLLSNYLSIMVIVMYILVNTCVFSLVYLPSYAERVGVSSQNASILLTICGAMDIVGRLGFGILVDFKFLRPHLIIAASCACLGTVTHFIRLFDEFEKLIFFAIMQGLLGSTGQNLVTVLIVDVVGIQKLGKLLPLSSICNSFSLVIQHPVQGAIIEATGNFVPSYHYVGTCLLITTLLLLSEPFFQKFQNIKDSKKSLK